MYDKSSCMQEKKHFQNKKRILQQQDAIIHVFIICKVEKSKIKPCYLKYAIIIFLKLRKEREIQARSVILRNRFLL